MPRCDALVSVWKESAHETPPSPHDRSAPTHARRPAPAQLCASDDRLLSALCSPLRPVFPDPTEQPRSRAYPPISDLSYPGTSPLLLPCHPDFQCTQLHPPRHAPSALHYEV